MTCVQERPTLTFDLLRHVFAAPSAPDGAELDGSPPIRDPCLPEDHREPREQEDVMNEPQDHDR